MPDVREVVRQRLMLVKVGAATKSVDETADDLIALIVEECARIADEVAEDDVTGAARNIASHIRGLAQRTGKVTRT